MSGCEKSRNPAHQGVDKGQSEVSGPPEARDNRFSVLGIPDDAGQRRRAENKVGTPGAAQSAPRPKRREGRERGGIGWFPHRRESLIRSLVEFSTGSPEQASFNQNSLSPPPHICISASCLHGLCCVWISCPGSHCTWTKAAHSETSPCRPMPAGLSSSEGNALKS